MDIKSVYDIAGRAMAAQLVRLNTVASNLANAGSTTGNPKTTYKPLKAIFETQYSDLVKKNGVSTVDAVEVKEIGREPMNNICHSIQLQMKKDTFIRPQLMWMKRWSICLKLQGNIKIMLK